MHRRQLPFLLLAFLASRTDPLAQGQDAPAVLIRLAHDPLAHLEFLGDLANLRREPGRPGLRGRFAEQEEALRSVAREAEQRILAAGGRILNLQVLDPGVVVSGLPEEFLRGLPGVAAVEGDRYQRPASLQVALNVQHHDTQGANLLLDAQGLPVEGTGVVIGLIDTGIDAQMGAQNRPHRAFYRDANPNLQIPGGIGGSRILSAVHSDIFCSGACNDPEDLHGHGTRMASIAMGFRYNFNPGVANGAAPDAFLRSYRVDKDTLPGIASFFSMNEAIERAVQDGVDVILMPWDGTLNPKGGSNPTIDSAVLAGVPVILSGSNADDLQVFHGCYNGIVAGASDLQTVEPFSDPNFFVSPSGPLHDGRRYPELLAVGEKLTSAVPDNELASVDSYGTSGAAAITAGTVALMLQVQPGLTTRQIRALLVDSAAEVQLGALDARSLGYLRSKRAVQFAAVGRAQEGLISGQVSYRWDIPLTLGQQFSSTVAWDQQPMVPSKDLDLVLRDPSGVIVAASLTNFTPLETVRYQAAAAGVYTLTLEHISSGFGNPPLPFAITGIPTTPPAVLPDLCAGQVAVIYSVQQGTESISLVAPNNTLVKGCGLDKVVGARIGTQPTGFTPLSNKALILALPQLLPGFHIVTLDLLGGGVVQTILSVGGKPTLSAPYNLGSVDGGLVTLRFKPQAPFVIVGSLSLLPTSFPGFLELAIGAGGQQLFGVASGVLDSKGLFNLAIGVLPGTPALIGNQVYLQAALLDPDLPVIPLEASNVTGTLLIF
jgi:subtilisin family serine protease